MRPTFCILASTLLGFVIALAAGTGQQPNNDPKPKVVREQVQGQWRFPGEKLLRISGRVQVLSAHTLR
jgi:hypothetical protein